MSPVSARSMLEMCYVRLVIWQLTKGLILEKIAGEAIQKVLMWPKHHSNISQLYASYNKE